MIATPQDFLMWLKGLLEGHNLDHGLSAVLAKEVKRRLDRALESAPRPVPAWPPLVDPRQLDLFPPGPIVVTSEGTGP